MYVKEILSFLDAIRSDPKINPMHISLYMAIIHLWADQGFRNPVQIRFRELAPVAKISGVAACSRYIHQLQEYGYIIYKPSFDPRSPSRVYLREEFIRIIARKELDKSKK
jgi:hypothetical protein